MAFLLFFLLWGTCWFCLENYWFARKVAVEDFFGCTQCDAIDEKQRCEHASIQHGNPEVDIICGRRRP